MPAQEGSELGWARRISAYTRRVVSFGQKVFQAAELARVEGERTHLHGR
jgi:hypothetical protein